MARSRIIKPDFWNDEKLAKVSRDARLLFAGLWGASDDYGVTKGHPAWLRSQIFPYDADLDVETVKGWLGDLSALGVIIPFEAEGEQFYFIKHFKDHQKVDNPSKSRNPSYPGCRKNEHSENNRERLGKESRENSEEFPSGSEKTSVETETETETETEASKTKRARAREGAASGACAPSAGDIAQKAKKSASLKRAQGATEILQVYADFVKSPGADSSRSRAKGHIIKLLARGYKAETGECVSVEVEDLVRAVRNYATHVEATGSEERYRKNSGNFFGQDATFLDFMAEDYQPPTPAKSENLSTTVKSRGGRVCPICEKRRPLSARGGWYICQECGADGCAECVHSADGAEDWPPVQLCPVCRERKEAEIRKHVKEAIS